MSLIFLMNHNITQNYQRYIFVLLNLLDRAEQLLLNWVSFRVERRMPTFVSFLLCVHTRLLDNSCPYSANSHGPWSTCIIYNFASAYFYPFHSQQSTTTPLSIYLQMVRITQAGFNTGVSILTRCASISLNHRKPY